LISPSAEPVQLLSLGFLIFRGRVLEFGDELLELGVGAKVFQIVVCHQAIGILVPAIDGLLYGDLWGLRDGWIISDGGVFKITLAGKESLVYTFKGEPDGASPYTNLIQGSNGDFYGTTEEGGSAQEGTIFQISTLRFVRR
jgi:uncharacterized repeat protein (TIGR03803 family)